MSTQHHPSQAQLMMPPLPGLVHGQLESGLTYFIGVDDAIGVPGCDTIHLRLVVRVGSAMETDDERGAAHFVEHMGFKSTEGFEDNGQLVKAMGELGARYGPDLNASTGLTETLWKLDVPSKADKLNDAMKVLREWAFGIQFKQHDVDSERQIIEEEWRHKQSPANKIKEAYWQAAFPSHAARMPIGQLEFIRNGSPVVLESFYKKWYLPHNMAVVCTGSGGKSYPTAADIECLTAQVFGSPVMIQSGATRTAADVSNNVIPPPVDLPPPLPLPAHDSMICCILREQVSSSACMVEFYTPLRPSPTLPFFQQELIKRLYCSVMEDRLRVLASSGIVMPVHSGSVSIRMALHRPALSCVTVSVDVSGEINAREKAINGFALLATETERVRMYGFTQREFDSAKMKWRGVFGDRLARHQRHVVTQGYTSRNGGPCVFRAADAAGGGIVAVSGDGAVRDVVTVESNGRSRDTFTVPGDAANRDVDTVQENGANVVTDVPTPAATRTVVPAFPAFSERDTSSNSDPKSSSPSKTRNMNPKNMSATTSTPIASSSYGNSYFEDLCNELVQHYTLGQHTSVSGVKVETSLALDMLEHNGNYALGLSDLNEFAKRLAIHSRPNNFTADNNNNNNNNSHTFTNATSNDNFCALVYQTGIHTPEISKDEIIGAVQSALTAHIAPWTHRTQQIRTYCELHERLNNVTAINQHTNHLDSGTGQIDPVNCDATGHTDPVNSYRGVSNEFIKHPLLNPGGIHHNGYLDGNGYTDKSYNEADAGQEQRDEIPFEVCIVDLPESGATQFTLSNGLTVVSKTQSTDQNKIAFQGMTLGGASELDEVSDTAMTLLPDVVRESGLGSLDGLALAELESVIRSRVCIQKHFYHRGIGGSCAVGNSHSLESNTSYHPATATHTAAESRATSTRATTHDNNVRNQNMKRNESNYRSKNGLENFHVLLAMIRALFLKRSVCPLAFERVLSRTKDRVDVQGHSSGHDLGQHVRETMFGDPVHLRPLDNKVLDQVTLSRMNQIFRSFIASEQIDKWVLVFVGPLPVDLRALGQLFEEYLGSKALASMHNTTTAETVPVTTTTPTLKTTTTPPQKTTTTSASASASTSNASVVSAAVVEAGGSYNELCGSIHTVKPWWNPKRTGVENTSYPSSHMKLTPISICWPSIRTREQFEEPYIGRTDAEGNASVQTDGDEDKATVLVGFPVAIHDLTQDVILDQHMRLCAQVLRLTLLHDLRTKHSLVYSVSVEWSRNSLSPLGIVFIGFSCGATGVVGVVDKLEECVKETLERGLERSYVEEVLVQAGNDHERAVKNGGHWLFWLLDAYKRDMIRCGGQRRDAGDVGWVDACVNNLASAGLTRATDGDALRMTLDGALRHAIRVEESVIISMVPNRQTSRLCITEEMGASVGANERARSVVAKSS